MQSGLPWISLPALLGRARIRPRSSLEDCQRQRRRPQFSKSKTPILWFTSQRKRFGASLPILLGWANFIPSASPLLLRERTLTSCRGILHPVTAFPKIPLPAQLILRSRPIGENGWPKKNCMLAKFPPAVVNFVAASLARERSLM